MLKDAVKILNEVTAGFEAGESFASSVLSLDISGAAESLDKANSLPLTPATVVGILAGEAKAIAGLRRGGSLRATLGTRLGRVGNAAGNEARALISTGRTVPKTLEEKLAMEQVKSNPQGITPDRLKGIMNDKKNGLFDADGWVKRVQNVNGVEIHYVENVKTSELIDFKFAEPKK